MIEIKSIHPAEQKCNLCNKQKRVAVVSASGGGDVYLCQKDLWKFLELHDRMNKPKEGS